MKRQKRSMLQRMMAALLTALLVVSIAANAVPVAVLAQEDMEPAPAEETDSGEQKPDDGANPDMPETNVGGG